MTSLTRPRARSALLGAVGLVLLAGAARARGFRLDGYGVFFDVEVPALRRSVAWSFRVLDQSAVSLTTVIATSNAVTSSWQGRTAINLRLGFMLELFTAAGGLLGSLAATAIAPRPGSPPSIRRSSHTWRRTGSPFAAVARRSSATCGPRGSLGTSTFPPPTSAGRRRSVARSSPGCWTPTGR